MKELCRDIGGKHGGYNFISCTGVSADGAFSALARDALFRRTADGKKWGCDSEAEINVIWVNISNLRKKLKSIGSHVQINASRGLGYLLEAGK